MKKFKKLNRKGFTLIELLAVIVILAVVMGIAANSVLSSMNKSRGGSLADTAQVISKAFYQKYTESLVGGIPNNIYSDVTNAGVYNFQSSATYGITTALADTFNINTSAYQLASAVGTVKDVSTVNFNVTTGKFIVCMVANKSGNVYVDNYKSKKELSHAGGTFSKDQMWACSDGTNSWTGAAATA